MTDAPDTNHPRGESDDELDLDLAAGFGEPPAANAPEAADPAESGGEDEELILPPVLESELPPAFGDASPDASDLDLDVPAGGPPATAGEAVPPAVPEIDDPEELVVELPPEMGEEAAESDMELLELDESDEEEVIVAAPRRDRPKGGERSGIAETEQGPPSELQSEPETEIIHSGAFPPPPRKALDLQQGGEEVGPDELTMDDIDAPPGYKRKRRRPGEQAYPEQKREEESVDRDRGRKGKSKLVPVVVGLVVIVGAGLAAMAVLNRDKGPLEGGVDPEKGRSSPVIKRLDQSAEMAAMPSNDGRIFAHMTMLATASAKRFLAARNIPELLAVARHPERVKPLMEDFYRREVLDPEECVAFELDESFVVGNLKFWTGIAEMASDPPSGEGNAAEAPPEVTTIVLEQTDKGFFVDWENTVSYNPLPWEAYVNARADTALVFRVNCTLSLEYEHPFSDQDRYVSVALTNLMDESESVLYGYAEKESELGKRLLRLLAGDFERALMLKLQYPDSSAREGRSVKILELVKENWIIE